MNPTLQADLADDQVLGDVSTWTGPGPLVCFVLEAVTSLPWQALAPEAGAESHRSDAGVQGQLRVVGHPPRACVGSEVRPSDFGPAQRVMLSLLTYCYACGRYSSEEIERAIEREPVLRYLSAGLRPASAQIRGFRRRHRRALTRCLGQVLALAWRRRLEAGPDAGCPPHAEGVTCSAPAASPEPSTHQTPRYLWEADRSVGVPRRDPYSPLQRLCTQMAVQRIDQAVLLDSMALDD
jgi:hypothetical protein